MVELLLDMPTSPQQRRYCDVAKVSAHSLLDLINDILISRRSKRAGSN